MRLTDLLIIYLAAGAPVATYSIFYRTTEAWTVSLTVFLRNLIFWPVIAITIARAVIKNFPNNPQFVKSKTSDASISADAENLIAELNELKRLSPSVSFSQGFEEAVRRYAGLSAIIHDGGSLIAEGSFFSIADHPNKKVAAICLNRRNLNRMIVHRKRAAQDIARIFLVADLSDRHRNTFCDFLVRFACLYEDNSAAGLFNSVRGAKLDSGTFEEKHWLEAEHKLRTEVP